MMPNNGNGIAGEIDPLMVDQSNNNSDNNNNGETAAGVVNFQNDDDDDSDGKRKKNQQRRRLFAWGSLRFRVPSTLTLINRRKLEALIKPGQRVEAWCGLCQLLVEYFIYLLGPFLICLASAIIGLLVYTYFAIMQDMLKLYYRDDWYGTYIIHGHTTMVLFLLVNVVTNYALCVATSNTKGKSYDQVMREMALATGFHFPESPEQVDQFRKDYEDRMILRMQCRRQRAMEAANRQAMGITNNSSNNSNNVTQRKNATGPSTTNGTTTSTTTTAAAAPSSEPQLRPWMMMGPLEWGFCNRTNQPKPPRAHYCHVSKGLVFCLDHYCPWMFSTYFLLDIK